MSILRFVHTADLHLDSPFTGLGSVAPAHVTEDLRKATFSAYDNIIALCVTEQVDALLIAGDIYDAADRSLRAQLQFAEGLKQLEAAGIRSFICHGNHDPLNGWEARLDMPCGCVRFGAQVRGMPVFPEAPERAMVYGFSYPQREVRQNLAQQFAGLPPGGFNIGLLHANAGGNTRHEAYGACSIPDLAETAMDYWALGHIHTRAVLQDAAPTIVYPGNPQGRHLHETGMRGVYLVTVDAAGPPQLEFRPVDAVRWEHRHLPIAGLETEQAVLNAVIGLAESVLQAADGRPAVVRLTLTGRGMMNRWLRQADTADALSERLNEEYVDNDPWLWCERIQVDTASPVDRTQVVQREDFVGDLARVADELRQSPEAQTELQATLQELYGARRARQYLQHLMPTGADLRALLAAAEEECLAALIDDEETA